MGVYARLADATTPAGIDRNRDVGSDGAAGENVQEEWDNDEDLGVYMISLSEDAFFEMEKAESIKLQALHMLQKREVSMFLICMDAMT
jgi:hypothetical protein